MAPHQEIEGLVGTTKFHVGLKGNGIITLYERIQKFMYGYGFLRMKTFLEIIPLQHPGDSVLRT